MTPDRWTPGHRIEWWNKWTAARQSPRPLNVDHEPLRRQKR